MPPEKRPNPSPRDESKSPEVGGPEHRERYRKYLEAMKGIKEKGDGQKKQ